MSTPHEPAQLSEALAMRRRILGDAYVDNASRGAESDPGLADFQEYLTSVAWTVWTRPGLGPRERSLMVLAMTASLGRMEEFKLHARSAGRAGVSDAELDEMVFQVTAYSGAPAGVAARRALREVRSEPVDGGGAGA